MGRQTSVSLSLWQLRQSAAETESFVFLFSGQTVKVTFPALSVSYCSHCTSDPQQYSGRSLSPVIQGFPTQPMLGAGPEHRCRGRCLTWTGKEAPDTGRHLLPAGTDLSGASCVLSSLQPGSPLGGHSHPPFRQGDGGTEKFSDCVRSHSRDRPNFQKTI